MFWKDECILSSDEALVFIRKQIPLLTGVSRFELTRNPRRPNDFEQLIVADILPKSARNEDEEPLLLFETEITVDENFSFSNIGTCIEDKGLGSIALKCVLGIAYEYGFNEIEISSVDDDGYGFWPAMGAVPISRPLDLKTIIIDSTKKADSITAEELERIGRIAGIAGRLPYPAWQILSQMQFSDKQVGRTFKSTVFKESCEFDNQHNMTILPSEFLTRNVLERRLGILPPFRPLGKTSKFSFIARALHNTPKIVETLDL